MIRPIKKILVANRGEIAARIMRTCRRLGIDTVGVYSEADRDSPHVLLADQAICIGPPPSRDSYLAMGKIIAAAKNCGADAIHPGYGFLSENDQFAHAVMEAGIIFIGPSPESIRMMGNKLAAKKAAKDFNIPMVPGPDTALSDIKEAIAVASGVGYPLLIKAAAGGGGKGMRIVNHSDELESQVERAMSEALASFGDGSVFIEKYITSPRHIEIQVMADNHGHCLHFFERECSIQRRHQKIIEEAPSSILTPEKRKQMGEDAIMVAQSCHYSGAGTVEFLLDENNHHYFLEMNTRLQVEHPVTEMITGFDLVEMQIRIAEGHPLSLVQEDLKISGHALELRVYAEDTASGFIPATGKLTRYRLPHGEGIRVDDGYREGMDIPIHYDPMIAKLIVHAPSRIEAIEKMKLAIKMYEIEGVETTLEFGEYAISHPAFRSGQFDTRFVEIYMPEFLLREEKINHTLARFAAWYFENQKSFLLLPEMEK
ncbi:MAG: acetyl-CoA carboxylase biotin carboxylase subunit [Saprospiraceae bacterium]|nr:acetyl-CoA carboxylase biotin carboxylase subunit [Saprospiraceae bacterium]